MSVATLPESNGVNPGHVVALGRPAAPTDGYRPLPPLPAWALDSSSDEGDDTACEVRNMATAAPRVAGQHPPLPAWALEPASDEEEDLELHGIDSVKPAVINPNALVHFRDRERMESSTSSGAAPGLPAQVDNPALLATAKAVMAQSKNKDPETMRMNYAMCMHSVIKHSKPKDALDVIKAMMDAEHVDIHACVTVDIGPTTLPSPLEGIPGLKKPKPAAVVPRKTATGAEFALRNGFDGGSRARGGVATTVDAALTQKFHRSEARAETVARNGVAMDALSTAASVGSGLVVVYLLSRGANVNSRDTLGATPLQNAIKTGQADIVQILARAGADIHAVDNEGLNPLHVATSARMPDMVALLLKMGANVNAAEDVTGLTALCC
jgi:hypothetical protein